MRNISYLIEVPESDTKPHQFESRYFMRLDGQTKTAPHHYIEALFKQIKYPNLGGYIKFENLYRDRGAYLLNIKIVIFNHSPLQNEENVSFRLTLNPGKFLSFGDRILAGRGINHDLGGSQIAHTKFASVLHYGSVPFHLDTISIVPRNLIQNNNELHLYLMFGGKYSPMKSSEYKLRISHNSHEGSAHLSYEVYLIDENVLMYDRGKDKGEEMDKVNRFLER